MELELESILLPGIEEKRPLVIAGPCSAETEEQVMDTAKQLAAKGMKIFRLSGIRIHAWLWPLRWIHTCLFLSSPL